MEKEKSPFIAYRIGLILFFVFFALLILCLSVFDGGYDWSESTTKLRSLISIGALILIAGYLFGDRNKPVTLRKQKRAIMWMYTLILFIILIYVNISKEFFSTPGWAIHSLVLFGIWEAAYILIYNLTLWLYAAKRQ